VFTFIPDHCSESSRIGGIIPESRSRFPGIPIKDVLAGRVDIHRKGILGSNLGSMGISLNKRKSIEHIFGWIKNIALLRKLRHRGRARVQWQFTLALSAYNMVRMRSLALHPV